MSKIISWRSRSRSKSEEKPAKYIPAAIIPSVAFIANPSISTEFLNLNATESNLRNSTFSSDDIEIDEKSNNKQITKPIIHKKTKSISETGKSPEKNFENVSLRSRSKTKKKFSGKPRPEEEDYEITDSKRQIGIANGLYSNSFPESTNTLKTPEIQIHDYEDTSHKEEHSHSIRLSNDNISLGKNNGPSTSYFHLGGNFKQGLYNKEDDIEKDVIIHDVISNISEDEFKIGFENLVTEVSFNEEDKLSTPFSFEKSLSDKNINGDMDPLTTISNEALSSKSQENIGPNPSATNTNHFIVSESPAEMEFIQKNLSPKSRKRQMKAEIRLLHDTVYRLNMALTEKISENEPGQFVGKTILPGKGPVPSWIMNTKYLAPLFIAHDKKCRAQTVRIQKMQVDINNFEKELRFIVKENERLHLKLQENQKGGPASNQSDWQVIVEQAKLVIEENHLLLEELDIQQKKFQITEKNNFSEIAKLKKALLSATSERDAFDEEIKGLTRRIAELKGNTLPINAFNPENRDGDSKHDIVPLNQLKLLENQIEDMKSDKRNLEREIENLKENGKKDEKKIEKYVKIIESEKKFRDYFNSVLEKSDDVVSDRNYLMDKMETLHKEIGRIENRITVAINCRTNLNIGEHEIRKFRQEKDDSIMNSLYSIESWMDLLLEKYVDSLNLNRNQETEIVKSLNLLKEKDSYIEECLQENEAMEQKLESLLRNAINEY